MASSVEICNRALIRLGADTITALDEDSVEARICNIVFDAIRKDLLRSHPWNFAVKRAILAQVTDDPEFGFFYRYSLPSDYLMVIDLDTDTDPFKVEGGYLLTDSDEVNLTYVADITDTGLFDSMFTTLFSIRIALEVGFKLTGSQAVLETLRREYRLISASAQMKDGQEGTPPDFISWDWLDSRF